METNNGVVSEYTTDLFFRSREIKRLVENIIIHLNTEHTIIHKHTIYFFIYTFGIFFGGNEFIFILHVVLATSMFFLGSLQPGAINWGEQTALGYKQTCLSAEYNIGLGSTKLTLRAAVGFDFSNYLAGFSFFALLGHKGFSLW